MRLLVLTAALALLAGSVAGILFTFGDARGEIPQPLRFLASSQMLEREAAEIVARDGPPALPQAQTLLREAVRRDPSSPYRWAALAETYLASENTDAARRAMRRAVELGPNLPPILIRAANLHFVLDEPEGAMACGRRILALITEYDAAVFALYTRMGIPLADVLASGIPPLKRPAAAYFRNRLGSAQDGDLKLIWNWLASHGWNDDKLASEYVDQMLGRRNYAAAAETWAGYLGNRRGDYLLGNRLYNGGFEEEFTGAALDWRLSQADGAKAERDAVTAHTGGASLRVDFLGQSNVSFYHVTQAAVVEPGPHHFRAFVKTVGVTTDQGVRFRIADPTGRLEVITESMTGDNGWTTVACAFQIPPGVHLVNVQVVRQPSMKFDNRIRGTAWIDDVELVPSR